MNILRHIDMFQQNLTFTHNNKSTFRTIWGGIVTLIILWLLVVYFIILLTSPMKMVNKSQESISDTVRTNDTATENSDLNSTITIQGNVTFQRTVDYRVTHKHYERYDNETALSITKGGWGFAISIEAIPDPSYYSIGFYYQYSDNTGQSLSLYLPPTACTTDNLPIDDLERVNSYALASGLIWADFKDNEFRMVGDFNSHAFSNMQAQALYCMYEDYWVDFNTIYNYLYYTEMRLITVNSYYDHSDLNNPIKSYVKMMPETFYSISLPIFETLTFSQSEIRYLNNTRKTIFETKEYHALSIVEGANRIFYLSVRIDPHYDIYQQYINYQPVVDIQRRILDNESTTVQTQKRRKLRAYITPYFS